MDSQSKQQNISTRIGDIAVFRWQTDSEQTPVIFLHGVYFDHHLWDAQIRDIDDRTVIALDMPLHGKSRNITARPWNLDDGAEMLIEVLDRLHIRRVIAVGHSWGSMTILRAAFRFPERFKAIGLCNMPFRAATLKQKLLFPLQHRMLLFRKFYTRQAAAALFAKDSLRRDPALMNRLAVSMDVLSNADIKLIDRAVILEAGNAEHLIAGLKVRAMALKGEHDYVPVPPGMETVLVKGGHISPLEEPNAVSAFIKKRLLSISDT